MLLPSPETTPSHYSPFKKSLSPGFIVKPSCSDMPPFVL